jgi:hypothetical protein
LDVKTAEFEYPDREDEAREPDDWS